MTRERERCESGFYHVMVRGNGKMILFEDDWDYRAFRDYLGRACASRGASVIAWCLMSNHAHVLLRDDDGCLSEVMRQVESAYARRFNSRYGHVGHVFQGRFLSEAIEDEAYLLEVVRYIHNNPESAGVCKAPEYPWSSYREYLGADGITDCDLVLGMLDVAGGFEEFCATRDDSGHSPRFSGRVERGEELRIAHEVLGAVEPSSVKGLGRARRDDALVRLRAAGLTLKQVSRLTGISERTISRVTHRARNNPHDEHGE